MRYHFGSLAPNPQMNRQPGSSLIQRSSPTCTLSLANVTASTASKDTFRDSDAMVVDPPSFSMTSLSTVGNAIVPFPTTGKRTHSLLRATAYCAQLTTASARHADEACSADPDPPRKRTRTSALPSSKTRFNRATSPSNLDIHSNRSTSDSSPQPATPKSIPTSVKNDSQLSAVAQSNSLPGPSQSIPISPASQLVPTPLVRPIPSSRWRYKRATAESRVLMSLHQALVYGLALRYPTGKSDIASPADATDDMNSGPSQSGKGGEDALLYVQDAILSQRLRKHLLSYGIDAFREAFRELNSGLPSVTQVVVAYQKLVASLIIRHRGSTRASTSARNNSTRRFQRRPSRLSVIGNSD